MHDRVMILEENIVELENLGSILSFEKHSTVSKQEEWALRFGVMNIVQIVADLSYKIVDRKNLGNNPDYDECITLLATSNYLEALTARKMCAYLTLREPLMRADQSIDMSELLKVMLNLDDFKHFATQIKAHLN